MRISALKRLTFILFSLLIVGLAYHQLFKGDDYYRLSQNNRIKLIRLTAARGTIYDRQGKVLAGQRASFNAAIILQEAKDPEQIFAVISSVLGRPRDKLRRQFKKEITAPFIPVAVAQDIPKEQAIVLECRESDIPGLNIQIESLRDYRYGEITGHILGYLGRVSESELAKAQYAHLWANDLLGRGGVEEQFDYLLRGASGGMQVEVNNRGYKVGVLGAKGPQAGADLYLTIDTRLQEFAFNLLTGEKGAVVVLDPRNGEILAMVSRPGFDPELFTAALKGKPQSSSAIRSLLASPEAALLNRAISGLYSPGSIFKIVVAAAGLETGKITPQTEFECPGSLRVGDREFFCWKRDGHGKENVVSALAHSCNVFFYKLGLMLGPERIAASARRFGLGRPTGVDLPYESSGLVPTKNWKVKTYKESWYDGETANFAIGQGYLLVTPLQIARVISAVANDGYLITPHVVKKIADTRYQAPQKTAKKIALREETLAVIREGMRQVVQSEQGTGRAAYIRAAQWAAKTGTAQTAAGAAHGWFGGFYPYNQPRIVVLVFLEHGGSGGALPAKIAKRIVEYIRLNSQWDD